MSTIQYLLESAFCLACFYAIYWLALRRETFFQWNRLYLLLAPLAACALPALHWQLAPAATSAPVAPVFDLPVVVDRAQAAPRALQHALEKPMWSLTLGDLLWWVYLTVAGLFLVRLTAQVLRLWRFIRQCRRSADGSGVVLATGPAGTPMASFFGFVFWHPGDAGGGERQLLFEHEMVHVRQWHSLDLILMQLLIAFQWFNPLLYAYRRSLRAVHEYIADDYVVRRTRQRYAYASLLARWQSAGNRAQPGLVNTFHSLIQKRMIMMAKQPSHPLRRVKYLLLLPAFASLMVLFSFRLIERLPVAAPLHAALQSAEHYAAQLSGVTVVAPALRTAEPSPYILFWGAFQAKFEYLPATGRYLAEIHISPEELQEAVKREPRIWNGTSLEQHLSLEIGGRTFASDYNDPDVYRQKQADLSALFTALQPIGYLSLERIALPGGKWGNVNIFLDGKKPKWVTSPPTIPIEPRTPVYDYSTWGSQRFSPGESRFMTEAQFWSLIQAIPTVFFADGHTRTPEKWGLAIVSNGGVVLRPPDGPDGARSLEQLRARLQELKDQIRPGVKIWLSAWDLTQPAPEAPAVDTVITFDPETYKESVSIVRRDGPARLISHEVAGITILPPYDPRLLLSESDTRSYRLECGPYPADFIGRYAVSYTGAQGERLYADAPVSQRTYKNTRNDILQMLRSPLRFFRGNEPLTDWNLTIDYKGLGVAVKNGEVPGDLLAQLERELQPGDVLRFTGLQARTGGPRQIAMPKTTFHELAGIFSGYNLKEVRMGQDLVGLFVPPDTYESLRTQLGARPDLYWQYGDIDLSTVTLELEVRSEDPKPPLKPAAPAPGVQPEIGLQVRPNPAHETAVLDISLPQDGPGLLTVTNAAGAQCYSLKTDFHAGRTPFKLPLRQIKSKGMLYIRLEMPYGSAMTTLEVVE